MRTAAGLIGRLSPHHHLRGARRYPRLTSRATQPLGPRSSKVGLQLAAPRALNCAAVSWSATGETQPNR